MLRGLKNFYHLLAAILAVLFYRFPAFGLTVIGVTGTDGKTTTVHLIGEILKKARLKVAIVSSVAAYIDGKEMDTGFHVTTPDSWSLQKLLRQMRDLGLTHVVLEATSHGFDQHRLLGANFKVGVLTNITHEHLDYHQTYEKYLKAKVKLFHKVRVAVLNRDDVSYPLIRPLINPKAKIITYGLKKGDLNLKNFPLKTLLPGDYNLSNCLAAAAGAQALGMSQKTIKEAIASFSGVTGRLEKIDGGQPFNFFVDFAHTPNALENVLKLLRTKTKGRLIAIFGCAGLRDASKRPLMGEISCRLADVSVLTAEDPRTEDLGKIIEQIVVGCKKAGGIEGKTFFRVPDRSKAIKFAVSHAKKDDTIVICGKGHEKSLCFGKIEYPWSDQEAARLALK